MGKKPRQLRILTDLPWEEFEGHEVTVTDFSQYDLIVSPKAWLMDELHRKWAKDAIKEARKRRYPNEKESA